MQNVVEICYHKTRPVILILESSSQNLIWSFNSVTTWLKVCLFGLKK